MHNSKSTELVILNLLLLLIVVLNADAQIGPEPMFPPPGSLTEVQLRQFASRAEVRGDFKSALHYYRQMRETQGHTRYKQTYYKGELRCLLALKRFEEAEGMVQNEIDSSGNALSGALRLDNLLIDLGEVYLAWGKEYEAWLQWNSVLNDMGNNIQVYRSISGVLMRARQVDKAVAVLKKGEARMGGAVLALDLARAYTALMDYGSTVEYYLVYLRANPSRYSYVERAIYNFTVSAETAEAVIEALKSAEGVKDSGRLLIGYLFSLGRYEDALNQTMRGVFSDKDLIEFAVSLNGEGRYDLALEAFERAVEKFPQSPLKSKAMLGMAECIENLGRFDEALRLYREVALIYPHSNSEETALYRIGIIFLEENNLPDSASVYFDLVKRDYRRGKYFVQAGLALGKCAVISGDLPSAIQRYGELSSSAQRKTVIFTAEAMLMLARCYLWAGEVDSALAVWDRLSRRFPETDAANDALNDAICFKDISDNSFVREFAAAWLGFERGMYEKSLNSFRDILEHCPETVLCGRSVLLGAKAVEALKGSANALDYMAQYVTLYPNIGLRDEIYFRMAEICLNSLGDVGRAREYYETLLLEEPDSPLAPVVRRKLESLEPTL